MGGIADRFGRIAASWRYEIVIFTLVALMTLGGALTTFQQALDEAMFRVVTRPASGDIVIVQIDPKSLSVVHTWPWPRSRHAEVIAKLHEAGAELIGLDIDFSSPSEPEEDAALAKAIAAADGRVVLPSFIQHTARGVSDELIETNPLPALRTHAMTGNANVFAPGGKARRGSFGLLLDDGHYRPTFAALIGQQTRATITDFNIDFGIDAATIPRLSVAEVLSGSFDRAAVKGKRIIVGATAIELGDFVPVPVRGIIPGVELQATMAESILQGRTLMPVGLAGTLALVALALLILRPTRGQWTFRGFGLPLAATTACVYAAPFVLLAALPVMLEAVPALVALLASLTCVGFKELSSRARAVLRERTAGNMRRVLVNLIVDESSDGVIVADQAGRIELCNERAAVLLNATRSTLMRREVGRYLPRFDEIKVSAEGGETQRQTEYEVDCDGGSTTLDISVRRMALPAPAQSGDTTRIDVYTLHDITARRRTEEAERRAQHERFVAERAKSNFIANMSHELRTPLNAIIGFSEMMAGQLMGPLGQPQYLEFSEVIAKSGHHLLSLVNNILEISRIEHDGDSLTVEEIDFDACAEASAQFARTSRDYKSQTVSVHIGRGAKRVKADRRIIKHTLANLLSNAVKFTKADGSIDVRAFVEGDAFVFEVRDDGAGIDPALMPHLTDLFRHADQGFTRKHEGMGAGLYLVKRYIDLMKGTLTFESELGKGTRVRVTLPGAAVPVAPAAFAAA